MNWFNVNHIDGAAFVGIFDNIGICGANAEALIMAIGDAPKIELSIDSCGGCTKVALAIYDCLRTKPDVTATITGRAFSSAAVIALAADRRRIAPTAKMMLHGPTAYTVGHMQHHEMAVVSLGKLNCRLNAIYADRTGRSIDAVMPWTNGHDHYLTAQQSIDAGLCHEILPEFSYCLSQATPRPAVSSPGCGDFPDESLFKDFLKAFPKFKVESKSEFFLHLQQWSAANIYE